jgi:hypothetical protein
MRGQHRFSALAAGAARAMLWGALSWGGAALAEEQPAPPAGTAPVAEEPAPEPPPPPPAPDPKPSFSEAIAAGKPILEVRLREEYVDQANFAKDASALTVRTRFGWETASWNNLKATLEFENVQRIGGQRYNTTTNGRTTYPVIGDPDVTELNRAQIVWKPNDLAVVTVGRQRINLDDQRFIGAAAWRQDEQTFDAARVDLTWGKIKATYIYLDKANRVFGQALDWDSDSHALNVTYSFAEPLKLQGFLYALNFKQSAANSSLTYGVKASGSAWVSLFKVAYGGTYAHQLEYRNNPARFSLDYWEGDLAGTFDIYTLKASYENLGGNGAKGFATPLATLHAFQGWADVFLNTPGSGVQDVNVSLAATPRLKFKYLYNLAFVLRYHDFRAATTNASLGTEWNVQLQGAINGHLTGLVKYADYQGPKPLVPAFASRRKLWLSLEYKL